MLEFRTTTRFHRDAEGHRAGDVAVETMEFVDLDAAIAWGEATNAAHADTPFHVTGVFLDSRNFCMFSMETLSEEVPGFDDLPWNEVDAVDAPSEQQLFELANGPHLYSEGELAQFTVRA